MLQITDIRLKRSNQPTVLATASIQLDNCLVIKELKLIQLKEKRIVSFPNKKMRKYTYDEGTYKETYEYTDIVHPSNSEFRNYIETELFKIYDKGEFINE